MATKLSELPTGQAISKLIDETVTASRTAASTNTVIPVLTLNRQSSGTPGAGIGGSLAFNVLTAAGNTETGATIEAVTTDVTATSEDFALSIKTMAAGGAAAERVRINYDGIRVRSFNGSPGYDFGSDNVAGTQAMTLFDGTGNYGVVTIENSGVVVGSNKGFFSSGSTESNINTRDTGLVRSAAGVWRASNGSTGTGVVLQAALVEANTAGSGAPNVLTAIESGTILTNEGATAQNYHTLPTAVAGLVYEFAVQDADGIRVVAATGDTIQDVGTVSATAGYIQSTTIGSVIRLAAINATQWVVMSKQGTWTVDS